MENKKTRAMKRSRAFAFFFPNNSSCKPNNPLTMAALSNVFLSGPHRPLHPGPTFTPLPLRPSCFSTKATSTESLPPPAPPSPPPPEKKKSFAVATGELFLGMASRLIIKRAEYANGGGGGEGNTGLEKGIPIFPANDWADSWWSRRSKEEVSSVVEDPVQPEVVWEQREEDVEAERGRKAVTSPGFSFSAAGLLFPYHLGVAQLLLEKGYIKDTTPLAGSSAGAIVCAVVASGATMEEALKATKILSDNCRMKGTAFRLGAVLRDVLETFLPDDAHIRSNGRVRVAVTQLLWRPRGLLVDHFDSKEDLINAVVTSSFIPGYLAPTPATMFRNRVCVDGGLTLFMPPTSASQTVRVCAFPASRLGLQGIGISPDCNPGDRATPRELFNWALEPAEDHVLDRLFEWGYSDASAWAKENPVEDIVQDNSSLAATGATQ